MIFKAPDGKMRKMEEEIFVANSKGDVKALGISLVCCVWKRLSVRGALVIKVRKAY
jgi:hypothetical protein